MLYFSEIGWSQFLETSGRFSLYLWALKMQAIDLLLHPSYHNVYFLTATVLALMFDLNLVEINV